MAVRAIYERARRNELRVVDFLTDLGLRCERSVGSRGPADIYATDGKRRTYLIQVRERPLGDAAAIVQELLAAARRIRARALLAIVDGTHVVLKTTPKGTIVYEGRLRRLRREIATADRGSNVRRFWWVSRRRAQQLLRAELRQDEMRREIAETIGTEPSDVPDSLWGHT